MWQLYQFPLCPFSRKVRLVLGEKGVAHELVREYPWERRDEFVDLNPAGETPVLVDSDAGTVLTEQKANTISKMDALLQMRDHAYRLQKLLGNGHCDLQAFGSLLDEGWNLKHQLASTITTTEIDTWYGKAKQAGAFGGKLCGAGGGGFLVFLAPTGRQGAIRQALSSLREVKVGPEAHGSQVLFLE